MDHHHPVKSTKSRANENQRSKNKKKEIDQNQKLISQYFRNDFIIIFITRDTNQSDFYIDIAIFEKSILVLTGQYIARKWQYIAENWQYIPRSISWQ